MSDSYQRPASSSLLSYYLADWENLDPYRTFVTRMPSMTIMEEIMADQRLTKYWNTSFGEEQRSRSQVVIDDHQNSLRRHLSLNSPHSLNRAELLWLNYNELPMSCPATPKEPTVLGPGDLKNDARTEDTIRSEAAPLFDKVRAHSAPNRLLATELTTPIKYSYLEEQRRQIEKGWRCAKKGNQWVSWFSLC